MATTDYAGRATAIRDRLARHLADEADQPFQHFAIRARWQDEAQRLIDQWGREPREQMTDAERLCQEALENSRAEAEARAERERYRKALREAQEAENAPDPTIATLNLRDALTGQIWAITLPADAVARVITNTLRM